MTNAFEIGTTYTQTYANGEATVFTPTERLKNGNWRGIARDVTMSGREKNARQVVVPNASINLWVAK